MKVKFTREALDDLDRLASYIGRDNVIAACKVVSILEQLSARIAENPGIGLKTDIADLYVLATPRAPYLIFYRIMSGHTEIVHFRHTARDRPAEWRQD